jgi:outer membrane protein assembly factor BamD
MARGMGSARIIAGLMLATALAACSGAGGSVEDVPLDQYDAEQIFRLGEQSLASNRKAENAVYYFSEVERLYPYSEWAKRALIMEAYGYHKDADYENSRATAQRYIDTYPAEEDAAYAKYLLALSYYDQIDEVGRDQGLTFQALQALRAVIEEYPDSDYAKSAILKFDLAFDHLAAKEMEIGRYYLRRNNFSAALNRFRVVVEQYQTTTHTAEALYRLIECYLSLGLTAEAQTAGAILGHNYQSTEWYEDGYRLLTKQGLSPEAQEGSGWLSTLYRRTIKGEWL